jgi:hypothetical protein
MTKRIAIYARVHHAIKIQQLTTRLRPHHDSRSGKSPPNNFSKMDCDSAVVPSSDEAGSTLPRLYNGA